VVAVEARALFVPERECKHVPSQDTVAPVVRQDRSVAAIGVP
jgi:hypothetical protein